VTDEAVLELAGLVGTVAACSAFGRARATHYRRHRQSAVPPRPARVAHLDRAQPAALTAQERAEALAVLHRDRFCDAAPAQVWATLLDESVYLASESTFYRLLRGAHGDVRERRSQATHPAKVKPELIATKPNEVWSWDINADVGI
jgi:putative transposase